MFFEKKQYEKTKLIKNIRKNVRKNVRKNGGNEGGLFDVKKIYIK